MVTDREVRPFKFGCFELPDRRPLAIDPDFAVGLARLPGIPDRGVIKSSWPSRGPRRSAAGRS